jgi:high affinity Mn2+ porin
MVSLNSRLAPRQLFNRFVMRVRIALPFCPIPLPKRSETTPYENLEMIKLPHSFAVAIPVLLFTIACVVPANIAAQEFPTTEPVSSGESSPQASPMLTMLPRPESARIWLSGQANFISQWHPTFYSPYSGPNSLSAPAQFATSRVLTLFTGIRVSNSTEFLCDVQETGGGGIGEALGLAGFTNLDVVRNPSLSQAPYIARLMVHEVIPLGDARVVSERTPFSLFSSLPERRLEIRFGKFSLVDFFDLNSYGSDSNFQFMNWTVDNNGAYDYAADTRGYTYGVIFEYHQPHLALRFAEALMPKVANGLHLEADLAAARAENTEVEIHRKAFRLQEGTLRLLSYVNHANMGLYSEAVNNYLEGLTPTPEITDHPLGTTIKYGFLVNFEQPVNDSLGIFGRWGWNEGKHESYAYTEDDETFLLGVAGAGTAWNRRFDRWGFAFVSNGISKDHQTYLALGGLGFVLGDGRLNYGRENIEEAFYTFHVWRGIYPSAGLQHINDPGYNRDRGPVLVPTARLHLEF